MKQRLTIAALSACLLAACLLACGGGSREASSGADDDDDDGGSGGASTVGSAQSSGQGSGGATTVAGTVGMVVVDVQQAFVATAETTDMPAVLDRTKSAFDLAAKHALPFFLTFEASQQGDHALHRALVPAVPPQAGEFVKTTFDATGLPAFAQAVQGAGLSHLVLLGAETDVCVLQTVLGLRALGFTILLQTDAVFSEETNVSPALRRMEQAGARLVGLAEVSGFVENPSALPPPSAATLRITRPLNLGVVLHAFDDDTVAASVDPHETQKAARLRELLLVSEWFELPVYVADVSAGLPSAYSSYYQGPLRPLTQIASDAAVEQLVFAGTDAGIADAIGAWMGSRDIFVMEDALLALDSPSAQQQMLKPLFDAGLVPTTYKSFYYDMTKSVDLAEWPSQDWVARFDEYYWITAAPEDLPPIPNP
jgi:nicotinamidase-related amidase